MALYEDPLIGPSDMRFLQDMRRSRMQANQIQRAPVSYGRLGGAGMRSFADMSAARAEDALRAEQGMQSNRIQNQITMRAAENRNRNLQEAARLALAGRAITPFYQEGMRIFHRNRLQSDDDVFRSIYNPFESSGDTDKVKVEQPTARAPGPPKLGFGFSQRLADATNSLY